MKRLTILLPSFRPRLRSRVWSMLAAAAIIAAPLKASSAQYNLGNPTDVCGGSAFTFCLAISAVQGTGANSNTLFLTITNEALHGSNDGGYGSLVFTALGFNGITTAPSFTSDAGTAFSSSNGIKDLSNFKPGPWLGAEAKNPAPKNGLLFGESITFAFTNTTAETFAGSALAIHAQAGPGNCSSKLMIDLTQAASGNGSDFVASNCGSPVTATPEPASLALLATGFLGVGAMVRRRRTNG